MGREMHWADIVPLGHFATWACEPNPTLAETKALIVKYGHCHICGEQLLHGHLTRCLQKGKEVKP